MCRTGSGLIRGCRDARLEVGFRATAPVHSFGCVMLATPAAAAAKIAIVTVARAQTKQKHFGWAPAVFLGSRAASCHHSVIVHHASIRHAVTLQQSLSNYFVNRLWDIHHQSVIID